MTAFEAGKRTESGFLAVPEQANGAGILLLPAWWGLTPFFQSLCDRFAQEGFVTLAPDLYRGATASTIEEAKQLRGKLKRESVMQQILQATAELRSQEQVSKPDIGVIGFSLGGFWALWLAEQPQSGVAATVVFYATRNGDYTTSSSAFQFHLAETDEYVAASGVKKQQKSLQSTGKEAEFFVYPGTQHWFFESERPDAYVPEAAGLAWERTLEFFRNRL